MSESFIHREIGIVSVVFKGSGDYEAKYIKLRHNQLDSALGLNPVAIIEGALCPAEDNCEWCDVIRRRMTSRFCDYRDLGKDPLFAVRSRIQGRINDIEEILNAPSSKALEAYKEQQKALQWALYLMDLPEEPEPPKPHVRKLRIPE